VLGSTDLSLGNATGRQGDAKIAKRES
jgi:hypothetical protein